MFLYNGYSKCLCVSIVLQVTWEFHFNASESHSQLNIILHSMAEVEALAKGIWLGKTISNQHSFNNYITSISELELKNLKVQILNKTFPKSGGIVFLDPHQACLPEPEKDLESFLPRTRRGKFAVRHNERASEILSGLGQTIRNVSTAAVKRFCEDSDGLISARLNNVVYLKETITNSLLVVVKIPRNDSAVISLKREYRALLALQCTRRVAKIFSNSSDKAGNDFILTVYHPTSLEWSAHIWHNLGEVLLLCMELLTAVDAIHKKNWLVIGLHPGSILFNDQRKDPRDSFKPLRLTGLEHATPIDEIYATAPIDYLKNPIYDGFRAPELIEKKPPSVKSDIFSVGLIILAALLRRTSPFKNDEEIFRILHKGLPVDDILQCFNEGVYDQDQMLDSNHSLISLMQNILSIDPERRPTANQALKQLQPLLKCKGIYPPLRASGKVTQSIPGYLDKHSNEFL